MIARHSAKAADWRKPVVCASTESHSTWRTKRPGVSRHARIVWRRYPAARASTLAAARRIASEKASRSSGRTLKSAISTIISRRGCSFRALAQAQFREFIKSESAQFGRIVESAKITAE
jgi:hypothetical protein